MIPRLIPAVARRPKPTSQAPLEPESVPPAEPQFSEEESATVDIQTPRGRIPGVARKSNRTEDIQEAAAAVSAVASRTVARIHGNANPVRRNASAVPSRIALPVNNEAGKVVLRVGSSFRGTTDLVRRTCDEVRSPSPQSVPRASSIARAGGHIIVDALAGTGKTFTALEGMKRRMTRRGTPGIVGSEEQEEIWAEMMRGPAPRSVIMAAMSNAIKAELETKVPAGVKVYSLHGLGYQSLFKAGLKCNLDKYKTGGLIETILGKSIHAIKRNMRGLVPAVEELVKLCKINLIDVYKMEEDDMRMVLNQLIMHHGIKMPASPSLCDLVFDLVPQIMVKALQNTITVDYDDQLWLPIKLEIDMRRSDLMVVDERQDLNLAQQELAMRAGKTLWMVGDVHQAIFGFAGADVEASARMVERLSKHPLGCKIMPLTYSRRCAKRIVEYVENTIMPTGLKALPDAPEGEVTFDHEDTFSDQLMDGDMVVCRTNAPNVSVALRMLRRHQQVQIMGRRIGDDLLELIDEMAANDVPTLVANLSNWKSEQMRRIAGIKFGAEEVAISINDKFESVMAFTQRTNEGRMPEIEEIKNKIDQLFTDSKGDGVRFSSIHKAKGLEADRVFWLRYDRCPHPAAKASWQKDQERNLMYVAGTRAMTTLCLVKSAERKRRGNTSQGDWTSSDEGSGWGSGPDYPDESGTGHDYGECD